MRLSNLFTEDLTLESGNMLKGLMKYASRAMGNVRNTPSPRESRVKRIIREVYQEVWGDYSHDPKATARIDSYVNSIGQHMSKLIQINSEDELRHEITMLFRSRAERVPYSL